MRRFATESRMKLECMMISWPWKEMETQMVWPHLKILWHGEDNSARDSERSKERKWWEDNINEWTGMGSGDSLRAAEDREGWKGIVATSSVVPQRPPRLRDWERWVKYSTYTDCAIPVPYLLLSQFHNYHYNYNSSLLITIIYRQLSLSQLLIRLYYRLSQSET